MIEAIKYKELQCSVCGYIPDQEDIDKTNYKLDTCDTCGQKNVCDLCLYYTFNAIEDKDTKIPALSQSRCPRCSFIGHNRKFWLKELY